MTTTDEAIRTVRQAVLGYSERKNLTPRQIAIRAGLHANTLRGFEGDDWAPKTSTLKKLEALVNQ